MCVCVCVCLCVWLKRGVKGAFCAYTRLLSHRRSLKQRLHRKKQRMNTTWIISAAFEIASALAYLHRQERPSAKQQPCARSPLSSLPSSLLFPLFALAPPLSTCPHSPAGWLLQAWYRALGRERSKRAVGCQPDVSPGQPLPAQPHPAQRRAWHVLAQVEHSQQGDEVVGTGRDCRQREWRWPRRCG